ncbi:TPA: isochorismatase family protein [Vibrio vulnificus]|uniref:nicotinamidase n=1 Tax=Vibrio vulnificus TaxID=672 RepID=A0A8H9K755_VIBVL|nr:isochorismatase family protein [Vibrio vulnificus]
MNLLLKKAVTAALDVDPQKGFTPLVPELPVSGGHEIVDELNKNAQFAKFRVLSRDYHPYDGGWVTKTIALFGTKISGYLKNLDLYWPEHCVGGTKGAEILDGLPNVVTGYDFQIVKGTERDSHPYGACFTDLECKQHTGLIAQLKMWGVENVVIGGLAFDVCVKETAIQLRNWGFNVVINLASTRAVFPEKLDDTIAELKSLGVTFAKNSKELSELFENEK